MCIGLINVVFCQLYKVESVAERLRRRLVKREIGGTNPGGGLSLTVIAAAAGTLGVLTAAAAD